VRRAPLRRVLDREFRSPDFRLADTVAIAVCGCRN
jgi:hypothetical protein